MSELSIEELARKYVSALDYERNYRPLSWDTPAAVQQQERAGRRAYRQELEAELRRRLGLPLEVLP